MDIKYDSRPPGKVEKREPKRLRGVTGELSSNSESRETESVQYFLLLHAVCFKYVLGDFLQGETYKYLMVNMKILKYINAVNMSFTRVFWCECLFVHLTHI